MVDLTDCWRWRWSVYSRERENLQEAAGFRVAHICDFYLWEAPHVLLVPSQERPALGSGRASRSVMLTKCALHNKNILSRGKDFAGDFSLSCLLWMSYLTYMRKEAKKHA